MRGKRICKSTKDTCARSPLYVPLFTRVHMPSEIPFPFLRAENKCEISSFGTGVTRLEYILQSPLQACI